MDIAKAKMSSYQAQLKAAKTSLKIAKKQYQRMQSLKKQNAASTEDLENAEDGYESAMSKVAEIEASLKETEISLSTAETNLGYTKITAPLDGTIVSVPVKVGQTINAAMDTPTIVQIADLNQMEIYIEISEGDIGNIKPGVKVTYSVLADMNKVYETTLKSIDPGADAFDRRPVHGSGGFKRSDLFLRTAGGAERGRQAQNRHDDAKCNLCRKRRRRADGAGDGA